MEVKHARSEYLTSKKRISLLLLHSSFISINCMDWEDNYQRNAWSKITTQVEVIAHLKGNTDLQSYQLFIDTHSRCNDIICRTNGSTKYLCPTCKTTYKSTDNNIQKIISLEKKVAKEEEDYQTTYGNKCIP